MDSIKMEQILTYLEGKGRCFVITKSKEQLPEEIIQNCKDRYKTCIIVSRNYTGMDLSSHTIGYDVIEQCIRESIELSENSDNEDTIFIFKEIDKVDFKYINIIKIFVDLNCPNAKYIFSGESIYNDNTPEDNDTNRVFAYANPLINYNLLWILADSRSVTL